MQGARSSGPWGRLEPWGRSNPPPWRSRCTLAVAGRRAGQRTPWRARRRARRGHAVRGGRRRGCGTSGHRTGCTDPAGQQARDDSRSTAAAARMAFASARDGDARAAGPGASAARGV